MIPSTSPSSCYFPTTYGDAEPLTSAPRCDVISFLLSEDIEKPSPEQRAAPTHRQQFPGPALHSLSGRDSQRVPFFPSSFSTHHLLSLASTLPGDPGSDAFVGTGGLEKLLSFVWETSNPEILGETSHLCFPSPALSLVSILAASPSG